MAFCCVASGLRPRVFAAATAVPVLASFLRARTSLGDHDVLCFAGRLGMVFFSESVGAVDHTLRARHPGSLQRQLVARLDIDERDRVFHPAGNDFFASARRSMGSGEMGVHVVTETNGGAFPSAAARWWPRVALSYARWRGVAREEEFQLRAVAGSGVAGR